MTYPEGFPEEDLPITLKEACEVGFAIPVLRDDAFETHQVCFSCHKQTSRRLIR